MENIFNDETVRRVKNMCPVGGSVLKLQEILKSRLLSDEVAAVVDVNQICSVVQRSIDSRSISGALYRFQVLKENTAGTALEIYAETAITEESMGVADAHKTIFSGFLDIATGNRVSSNDTVTVTSGSVTLTDNGQGRIGDGEAGGNGTIDYKSGFCVVTFDAAPAVGNNPEVAWTKKSGVACAIVLETVPVDEAAYSAYVLEVGNVVSALVVGWSDSVAKDLKSCIRAQ